MLGYLHSYPGTLAGHIWKATFSRGPAGLLTLAHSCATLHRLCSLSASTAASPGLTVSLSLPNTFPQRLGTESITEHLLFSHSSRGTGIRERLSQVLLARGSCDFSRERGQQVTEWKGEMAGGGVFQESPTRRQCRSLRSFRLGDLLGKWPHSKGGRSTS